MWPLSWQGMLYTFIKADITAATLYIFNTIKVKSSQWITTNVKGKSPSWEANSCSAIHSITCLYRTYKFITVFTTAWLTSSPNFFSPPIFCTHIHSSLNNIAIRTHTRVYQKVPRLDLQTRMYLLDLSLGSIPLKVVPLCSDTLIPAPLPLLEVLFSKRTKNILGFPMDLLHSVKAATL